MALEIKLSAARPEAGVDAIAVFAFDAPLAKQKHLDWLREALPGLFEYAESAEFRGIPDQVLVLPTHGKLAAGRLILVGFGPKRGGAPALRAYAATAARALQGAKSLSLLLPDRTGGDDLRAVAEGLYLGAYRFTKYFTGERVPAQLLELATIHKSEGVKAGRVSAAERRAVALGVKVARAVCLARDAVNEPANELTPAELAARARAIAREHKLKAKVLDKAGILKAGMNLHYAVGQGSANEPRLIHLSYAPARSKRKVAFVGKGLTFDSGGLCIKPAAGMGEMKSDMGGAAAVLGLMAAVAAVKPNVEVHGIIGAAENMPDAAAYRPGDVFTSLNGKTVEIINTDAEGRLVLADVLTYAARLEPELIVDAATLTGACLVALGKNCSAFYSGDESLARQFSGAAKHAGEGFWRMPLLEDIREQLKSDIADLKHTGERWGGSISAALFLREFVGETPWIHCDVAGPVLAERARGIYPKGGTGHPVLTFLRFVEQL